MAASTQPINMATSTQTWIDMTEDDFFKWCMPEPFTPDFFNFDDTMLDMWPRELDILGDWKADADYAKWPSFGDTPNSTHCGVEVKKSSPVVINLSHEPAQEITPRLVRDERGSSVITVAEGIESAGEPESHEETESPEGSESRDGSESPEGSESGDRSESPGGSESRDGSESPEGSESRDGSESQEGSESPDGSESPEKPESPDGSESLNRSPSPDGSQSPDGSGSPEGSDLPEKPESHEEPGQPEKPDTEEEESTVESPKELQSDEGPAEEPAPKLLQGEYNSLDREVTYNIEEHDVIDPTGSCEPVTTSSQVSKGCKRKCPPTRQSKRQQDKKRKTSVPQYITDETKFVRESLLTIDNIIHDMNSGKPTDATISKLRVLHSGFVAFGAFHELAESEWSR